MRPLKGLTVVFKQETHYGLQSLNTYYVCLGVIAKWKLLMLGENNHWAHIQWYQSYKKSLLPANELWLYYCMVPDLEWFHCTQTTASGFCVINIAYFG